MLKIAHIVNPVVVNEESDLFVAQPITFTTMATARDAAREQVDVSLFTAQFLEDRALVPSGFHATPDLQRSVLHLGHFQKKRKLPLIKDILDSVYDAAPDADYIIYTNVDIGLLPNFYMEVYRFISQGFDAFVINRRTISKQYNRIDQIPLIYSDRGESHPGWDCFVFKREAYPKFILGDVCIGANLVGTVLLFNLLCTSNNFVEFKDEHLTFHIGDDMAWKSRDYCDYAAHNLAETCKVISELEKSYGRIDGEGRYSYLFTYIGNLKKEMPAPSYAATRRAPALNQRVICITGMARCGTSMVARILNIMGLYLGPQEELILQTEYNVEGCWEHKGLLDISEKIIAKLGWSGFQRPDWTSDEAILSLEDEAMAVLERDFAESAFWGWKDDRCSLTIPFWRNILPETEYVICVRNPIDTAKSLLKQKWVESIEEGIYRWLLIMSSAIKNTQGKRRLIVFFDDFLHDDWRVPVRKLAEFFGPSYVERLPEYEKEIRTFIRDDLRHHNTTTTELLNNGQIPYTVKHFYSMLLDCATDSASFENSINSLIPLINADAFRMNQQFLRLNSKREQIETLNRSIANLEKEAESLSETLNQQAADLHQQTAKNGALEYDLSQQAARNEALEYNLNQQDVRNEELEYNLNQQTVRNEELINSLSWKITKPLRRLYDLSVKGWKH